MPANTTSVHFKEIWSKYLIDNLDAETVALPYTNRQLEAEFAMGGDLARRFKLGDVTIDDYVNGTDMTVTNVTSTEDTISLDQSKSFNFIIDRLEIEKSDKQVDLVKGYTERARIAMAQTLDSFILARSAEVDSGNVEGSSAAPITLTKDNIYDYFCEMGEKLNDDNIDGDSRVVFVPPFVSTLLRKSEEFTHATTMGDEVIRKGKIGYCAGFEVVETNRIATSSGVKDILFFHKDLFLDVAVKVPPNYMKMYDPDLRHGTGLKGLMLYGAKSFHPTAGAVIKAAV